MVLEWANIRLNYLFPPSILHRIIKRVSNDQQNNTFLKVGLISLGCAKNLVDSEIMLGALLNEGIEITNDSGSADAVIVNTCSFIDSSKEESVDAILEADVERNGAKPDQALVVAGCLTQRYREELSDLIPEVDRFMGIDQVSDVARIVKEAISRRHDVIKDLDLKKPSESQSKKIVQALPEKDIPESSVEYEKRPKYVPDFHTPRFRLTPSHFAYLKIAEGCNHPCTFCTIPRMRGGHRSRAQNDIIQEAKNLIEDGVKEINLISQDSTYYGLDLRPERKGSISSPEKFTEAAESLPDGSTTLCTLLRELQDIPGEFWIRLLYTHPAHWTDELIKTISECDKVARYIDIPLQHIHPVMLQRMRRETSKQYIVDLIDRIRQGIPDIKIRTTFIVGFPGETEEYFQDLVEFVRATRFERLGVFTYSREESTPSAKMESQIHGNTKKRRARQLMEVQQKVSAQYGESQLGKVIRVLPEKLASASEFQMAQIHSWEHGHLRGQSQQTSTIELDENELFMVCRGHADAPDIDGRIYVPAGEIVEGEFIDVTITGYSDYDLFGELVSTP